MLKIAVLAFENCLLSGIAGQLDLFTLANWEYRRANPHIKTPFCRYEIVTADGEAVTSFNRMPVAPKRAMMACQDVDLVLIPGMMGRPEQVLDRQDIVAWLKHLSNQGVLLASACSGAFLLAETGLLQGRPATTHWQLADRFRRRFPKVNLQIERLLIDAEDYLCAGGTSAHNDLALYLIQKFGSRPLARSCARMMLLDQNRRDQAPFINFRGDKQHQDEAILRAQNWLEKHYRGRVRVTEMVELAGLNERTFLRRFRKATGDSPLEYLQRIRIEKAKQLLVGSNQQLETITRSVGYEDVSSFRRLFRQIVGLSPTVYRQRFSSP